MEISLSDSFQKLAIALGLGLLIGLQRERADSQIGGFRTFPLIAVFGTMCSLMSLHFGAWVLAAGLLGLAAIIISNTNHASYTDGPGMTTEVSMLLVFGIGAYLVVGFNVLAVVAGAAMAVLLHLKPEMHSFARQLGRKDFTAIMQFVMISLVILPVLPNKTFDPLGVLNPFKIWLMVVLIVGLSLGGYVFYKFLGARNGSIVNGLMGGLVSSTALTVSYARSTRQSPQTVPMATLAIMLASTVLFVRLLAVIGIVSPGLFPGLAGPLFAVFSVMVLISAATWFAAHEKSAEAPAPENPAELKPAIMFAAMFAIVLVITELANRYLGSSGLYAVAAVAGLTDLDAITLSTLKILEGRPHEISLGWRMILIAWMANLFFKAITVATLGTKQLLLNVGIMFAIAVAGTLGVLWLWPA